MASFVPSLLFANKLLVDDREPIATFSIPGVDGTFGFYVPLVEALIQQGYLAVICHAIQAMCGALVYRYIVVPRKQQQQNSANNKSLPLSSYLFGWAVIIPFSLWIPHQLLEYLGLHSTCLLKVVPIMIISCVTFKTLEAMYGTTPYPGAESSWRHYVWYFMIQGAPLWNDKTNAYATPTWREYLGTVRRWVWYHVTSTLALSVMMHWNFRPFPSSPVPYEDFRVGWNLLHPSHLANCYCLTVLTYYYNRYNFVYLEMVESAKGFQLPPMFRDPLWSSTSPTDFWGRRWNLAAHGFLKRGVFLPVRQWTGNALWAMVAAFVASGLFHEYFWSLAFYHHFADRDPVTGKCPHCFGPTVLKLTCFFLYNGALVVLDRPLSRYPPISWIARATSAPQLRFLRSTLVVLCVLPVSHWFTGDWVEGDFFQHWALSLCMIKKLPS